MEDNQRVGFSALWAGGAAVVLWALSYFGSISLVAIPLLSAISAAGVRPLFDFEKGKKGWKLKWEWNDWVGLVVLILVVVALINGTGPLELLDIILRRRGGA